MIKEMYENDSVFCLGNSGTINGASTLVLDSMKTSDNLKESVRSEKHVGDYVAYQHGFDEPDNVLGFFDNVNGKDSNDLSYYSWDDLGSFEDVDRMFRNWDSNVGLGTNRVEDLGWLSSTNAIAESEDVLKSDFEILCPESISQKNTSESEVTSISNDMTYSNGSEVQNSSAMFKGSGQLGILSFSNGTSNSGGTDNKDAIIPNGQINEQIKQMKLQNQSGNKKKDQYVGQNTFFYDTDVPEASDSHSLGYLQSDVTFTGSDCSFTSNQNSLHPAKSVMKFENIILTSVSPKDSYTLNKMQALDHDASSPYLISFAADEKRERMNRTQKLQASSNGIPKNMDFDAQASMPASISNERPIYYSGKSPCDRANIEIQREMGFPVAQNSSMSSGLDDISVEATSFRQLQLVMEQLDLRTKLCIRDSLYRLAQSAEQRHQYLELNDNLIDDGDGMLAEGSTKFPDFMDIETDTNPIDRSIAHLLFHRPSDLAVSAGGEDLSSNSPTSRLALINRTLRNSIVRLRLAC